MNTSKKILSKFSAMMLLTSSVNFGNAQKATPALQSQKGDISIRPFQYHATDQQLTDLKERILHTKWPDKELVDDASQGVQLSFIKKVADYWANDYDWRKVEKRMNQLPQFITNIDGVDIHFIHVRSKHKNALPVIITHGWPGSIIEQLKIIGPLTDPTAYGGKAEDAFDVVIPSIPGYGFSEKPSALGWTPDRIARAWDVLMKRLGYDKYVAQGGDWGNAITEKMGVMAPEGLLAIHTNMPATIPDNINAALAKGGPAPAGLGQDELYAYKQLDFFFKKGVGYAGEMGLRPQTLYGIADSPIGLASWLLDHDARSYDLITRVFDGQSEGLTRDDVLDNITLYWLTNTGVSSGRLFWENTANPTGGFFDPRGVKIPVAVSAFPDELYTAPESWAKAAYPNLIYYNRLSKGGHFAAWERPIDFAKELRMSFKDFR